MAYLMIAVAGVTHEDLLLETPVQLPILQVKIQLTQFFQFAPILLVLFHLGVISQLVLLARKTLEFDHAIRLLETTDKRTHPLRLELHNFFFVQAIAGPAAQPRDERLPARHVLADAGRPAGRAAALHPGRVPALPRRRRSTWIHRIALLARHRPAAADRRVPDARRDVVLPGVLAHHRSRIR